jgi:hypothetical protein
MENWKKTFLLSLSFALPDCHGRLTLRTPPPEADKFTASCRNGTDLFWLRTRLKSAGLVRRYRIPLLRDNDRLLPGGHRIDER